jgi:hypothetical protein
VAIIAAVFGRVRSPAAIVTMLAEDGQEILAEPPEDACDIGSPLAKAICLSSSDGMEMGSVHWVTKGLKSVGRKLQKVNVAGLLGREAPAGVSLRDVVDACDVSADTLERARCMGFYDTLSSASAAWVLRPTAAEPARSKLPKAKIPKAKIAGLWGSTMRSRDLQDEVDACDMSDAALTRALCMENNDPLSSSSANWVLNGFNRFNLHKAKEEAVGTTTSQTSKSKSAGGSSWTMWRTPAKSSPAANLRGMIPKYLYMNPDI